MSFLYFCIALILCMGLIAIFWRALSTRISIPCPTWLSWLVELDNPFFRNYRTSVIIEHLVLRPGMNVLDFGCGPGRLTIPVAKTVGPEGKVTAIDIQPGMLRKVRAKIEAEKLHNVETLQSYSGEERLESNAYDRVLLVTVLGEIPDKNAVLKAIFDSLKQKGILSITEVIADPHFLSCQTVRRLTASAGFSEKSFYGNRISYTINVEKP